MFRKTHIIGFAVVVVALALMAPIALANDGLVDDWFRDAKPAPQASIGLIDVTAQGASRPVASPALSAPVATRLVDDWFRDAKPAPQASIGLIDVTAQDVSRPVATGMTAVGSADRLVDDWFRDAKPAPQASIGLIDVTAQDVGRPLATAHAAPLATGSGAGGSSFAWGDFGLGAVAMLGVVALLIGLGALVVRHRGGQLSTS
jgi:hypothetical protein